MRPNSYTKALLNASRFRTYALTNMELAEAFPDARHLIQDEEFFESLKTGAQSWRVEAFGDEAADKPQKTLLISFSIICI